MTTSAQSIATPLLVGLLAVSYYILNLGQDLSWTNLGSDAGELITASFTLGIPHPPGYPTYVLLGKLFSFIPIGNSIAYRYNLFSAVAMAAATALAASAAFRLIDDTSYTRKRPIVSSIALGFALFPLVVNQAIVTEVYALNLALLAFLIFLCLAPEGKQHPIAIGLTMGLAMTTHLTSILFLPLVLLSLKAKSYANFTVGLVLGLAPFILLPFLAAGSSPVLWGDPATLRGWIWLVSAELYHPNIPLSGELAMAIFLAITILIIGFILIHQKRRGFTEDRRLTLTTILLVTAGLYFIFSSLYKTSDAIVFILPGILLLFVVASRLLLKIGRIIIILPLTLLIINFLTGTNIDDISPRTQGEKILSGTSDGAVLITEDEKTLFSLWYFQHVEGIRPDIAIIDKNLLQFAWYRTRLSQRYPNLSDLSSFDVERFIEANAQYLPICRTVPKIDEPVSCHDLVSTDT